MGLTRDGKKRLDDWLIIYCSASPQSHDQREYIGAVGAKWMISAVARVSISAMITGCATMITITFGQPLIRSLALLQGEERQNSFWGDGEESLRRMGIL